MNFDKFESLYKKRAKGSLWNGATGLYIISPSCPTGFWEEDCNQGNGVPRNIKIGKATGQKGLLGRLSSYKTYWPNGFTVHSVLIIPSRHVEYDVIKDYTTERETTLKRMLKQAKLLGFGADGKGGKNGTEKIPDSEWVHQEPSEVMPFFASLAKRHGADKLYSCNKDSCNYLDVNAISIVDTTRTTKRRTTRHSTHKTNTQSLSQSLSTLLTLSELTVPSLKAVLKSRGLKVTGLRAELVARLLQAQSRLQIPLHTMLNAIDTERTLGIRGQPVVATRALVKEALRPSSELHRYATQLQTKQNKEVRQAEERIKRKAQYEAEDIKQQKLKIAQQRLTKKRREELKTFEAKIQKIQQKLPKNVKAIMNTSDYATAAARTKNYRTPGRRRVSARDTNPVRTRARASTPTQVKKIQRVLKRRGRVQPAIGMRVEGLFGKSWDPGTIINIRENGTFNVTYDDTFQEEGVEWGRDLHPLGSPQLPKSPLSVEASIPRNQRKHIDKRNERHRKNTRNRLYTNV
jgi:hypothetical protein